MKKMVSVLIIAIGLGLLSHSPISAATPNDSSFSRVEVNLNGEFIPMDVHPMIDNSRLYIPIRTFASLGFSYSWNPSTKITTIQNEITGDYLKITVGSTTAYKNGAAVQMDSPAQNKDGRVLVPIRFVSENLGYHVQFESIRNMVFIFSADFQFDMKAINQSDLAAARKAAISLPLTADFKTLGRATNGGHHSYRFPVGRADTYIFNDGRFYTFVQIKDGKAIATGQYDEIDSSRAAGNASQNMNFDTDPLWEPFRRDVLFYKNGDGTATAAYHDDQNKDMRIKTIINVYSDIIQELPDHR